MLDEKREYESECARLFPKIWSHPHRKQIEEMVDNGVSAPQVSQWTYELSRERGIEPGNASNLSISYPVLSSYVKFRKEFSPKDQGSRELPVQAAEQKQTIERDAATKKAEAVDLLDRVIDKALQQLESGERVTLQNALQAITIRQQLEEGRKVEVVLSVEVRTVVQQIIEVVIQTIPGDLRMKVAEAIRRVPALRQIAAGENEEPPVLTSNGG